MVTGAARGTGPVEVRLEAETTGTVIPYDWHDSALCASVHGFASGGQPMSISANEARQRFYPLIRQVNEDHVPIEVTSREHGDVVIMSAEDFRSWQETVYLLRSPRNAQILMESIAELDAGQGHAKELIDVEDADGTGSAA